MQPPVSFCSVDQLGMAEKWNTREWYLYESRSTSRMMIKIFPIYKKKGRVMDPKRYPPSKSGQKLFHRTFAPFFLKKQSWLAKCKDICWQCLVSPGRSFSPKLIVLMDIFACSWQQIHGANLIIFLRACIFCGGTIGFLLFSQLAWRKSPVLVSSSGSLGISLPLDCPCLPLQPLRVWDFLASCLSLIISLFPSPLLIIP